ncbi:unnamed protein product [Fusarium venenatum]|uniref:Uncharacterized protein n=1 Tax=Fusarium venenatum TaxID=56646 RepID=A0A2L2THA1_9HYPO|nr:uncharacterized protein FVRRES_03905 [Fusarium venenatum]CEI67393.1 unnamed protein product [Fusarium venenatum]
MKGTTQASDNGGSLTQTQAAVSVQLVPENLQTSKSVMNIEAIIGIVAVVVAIPPTGYIIYKWYNKRQRNASSLEYGNTVDYVGTHRPESQMFVLMTERQVTFGLRV